mmetsp:Transcript_31583/g.87094  ORF Transcript_31583/g.87094 Transcript_31583/m.87094 type:complete len:329 (-) Transcript_31583:79-1065(-)
MAPGSVSSALRALLGADGTGETGFAVFPSRRRCGIGWGGPAGFGGHREKRFLATSEHCGSPDGTLLEAVPPRALRNRRVSASFLAVAELPSGRRSSAPGVGGGPFPRISCGFIDSPSDVETSKERPSEAETSREAEGEESSEATGAEDEPPQEWINARTDYKVTTAPRPAGMPSPTFYSPDIADNEVGEYKSKLRPNLMCKCGGWQPAPSHPTIKFIGGREPFPPQDIARVRVQMEDTTSKPHVLHWEAEYNMQRFRNGVAPKDMILRETHPSEPQWGRQRRFMTFCPKGDEDRSYNLKLTYVDTQGHEKSDSQGYVLARNAENAAES